MSIPHALAALHRLRQLLGDEVGRARDLRRLLRGLDGGALLERASARAAFNSQVLEAEAAAAEELRSFAAAAGVPEVSLEVLRRLAPGEAADVAGTLDEIRVQASTLVDLDALNRKLAHRAMRVVGAYVDAVIPRAAAYDRRGHPQAPRLSSHSTQA